jgi:hypothetical protein
MRLHPICFCNFTNHRPDLSFHSGECKNCERYSLSLPVWPASSQMSLSVFRSEQYGGRLSLFTSSSCGDINKIQPLNEHHLPPSPAWTQNRTSSRTYSSKFPEVKRVSGMTPSCNECYVLSVNTPNYYVLDWQAQLWPWQPDRIA